MTAGWLFLAHLLKIFGIVDFPYSNPDTQEIDEHDPQVIKYRYICMGILALVILPVNCAKNLGAMRYISMIIMFVVMYTISVIYCYLRLLFSRHQSLLLITVRTKTSIK